MDGGMTKWGVFKKDNMFHVVQCDKKGYIKFGHILDEICFCEPRIEDRLVIHNGVQ